MALSALFALGGRLADVLGHRRMVVIGVLVFAISSALCGATPEGQYLRSRSRRTRSSRPTIDTRWRA